MFDSSFRLRECGRVFQRCGDKRSRKGRHHIIFRTPFGKLRLESPRLYHCQASRMTGQASVLARSYCKSALPQNWCILRPSFLLSFLTSALELGLDYALIVRVLSRKLFENMNSLFANESDGYKTTSEPSSFRFSCGRSAVTWPRNRRAEVRLYAKAAGNLAMVRPRLR